MRTSALAIAAIVLSTVAVAPRAQSSGAGAITDASVRGHMEFLASDAMNGRGSGTRDEWIAAEYIASHLRRWGLEPIPQGFGQPNPNAPFVQQIELRAVETTSPPVLKVGSLTLTHGKGMIVQAIGSVARVAGPLMVYKAGMTVPTGATVLVPEDARSEDRAAIFAAAALMLTAETPALREKWDAMASRLPAGSARAVALPANTSHRATAIVLDKATYAAVAALGAGARVLYDPPLKYSDTPSYTWNVVGQLRGTDPTLTREVILLSAHLDHVGMNPNAAGADKIYNGADDDASGSTAVLELAHALAQGPRPKRTIVFAWFGSEERGGTGSNYFAELPVVAMDRIVANLQFEMIGRPDPNIPAKTLWLTGFERSNLGAELAKRGAKLVADPYPAQNFFTRSDNIRFARKGIPAHTVSSFGLHKDYHQPTDEIKTIDFPHMTEAIRSLYEPIRWLVNDAWRPEWAPGGRPR